MTIVSKINPADACLCGSKNIYSECCGPCFIDRAAAKDPITLMRSRYTAFVESNIGYLEQSMCNWACIDFDANDTRNFCKQVTWHGLSILDYKYNEGDLQGEVEFIAKYQHAGSSKIETIHERSLFEKIDGIWFYISMIYDKPDLYAR